MRRRYGITYKGIDRINYVMGGKLVLGMEYRMMAINVLIKIDNLS